MNKRRWMIMVLVFLFVLPASMPAFGWDKIVSFGDSLSDNGDADGYGFGVWSNGDVWLEYLADELDTDLEDRALGGALTSGHESGSPDYGLDWQVDLYISELPADADLSDTLYTVWIGGNDFLFMGEADPAVVIGNAINNITISLQKLIDVGAKNILIVNLPDLGLAPLYNWDPTASADASYLAETFNTYELELICGLNQAYPDVKFHMVDSYDILGFVVDKPKRFKFKNVTDADGAETNYKGYLFYDEIHPTTATHKIIAAAAIAKVKNCHIDKDIKKIIKKLNPIDPQMPFIFECSFTQ